MNLNNKTAVVTGGGNGIGKALCVALAEAGAKVVIADIELEAAIAVKAQLDAKSHQSIALQVDVSDESSVIALRDAAVETFGSVDILVNNAGLTRDNLTLRLKDEDWQSVIDVNLGATFRLCRAVMRGMMKRRWGRMINITSIVGVTGNPGQANYAASKAGMIGMSKSMAAEIANRGITINCVAPGFIRTAMTDELGEDQHEKLKSSIPAGDMGTPEDIANAVAFLSSDEAGYITGQTLHVNGGMAMI